jgi:hypothetical protein
MKKKVKPNKKGPDEGLVIEQIKELNKEFYQEYFEDYFSTKFAVLANIINQPDKLLELIDKRTDIGLLSVDSFGISQDDFVKFGKLELSTTYYHALETFLRLFLAHVCLQSCPWLEIARDTNYKSFKEKLKPLAEGKFNFSHNDCTSDEILTYVFTSFKTLPDDVNGPEIIKGLKEWIQFSAKETLEMYDYNAYKHGLTVSTGKRGFKFGDPDDIKLEEHQESLKIISKKEKDNRWIWRKQVVFTPFDFRGTCILVIQKLISNLLTVGKYTYLKEEFDKIDFLPQDIFVPSKIREKAQTVNKFGIIVEGYSMEMSYYKD